MKTKKVYEKIFIMMDNISFMVNISMNVKTIRYENSNLMYSLQVFSIVPSQFNSHWIIKSSWIVSSLIMLSSKVTHVS